MPRREPGGPAPTPVLDCRVWFASLAALGPTDRAGLLDLLDGVEVARRDSLVLEADRDRFTLGVAMTRWCAARHTGRRPEDVVVERGCRCGRPHGRPVLPDAGLHVSISHSDDVVVLAASTTAPVGVDVERRAARDTTGLARVALAPGESARGPDEFYRYWTRKEAVLKATGDGLQVPPNEVVVSAADEPARLLGYRGDRPSWALADLAAPAGYAAAVCVLASGTPAVEYGSPADLRPPARVPGSC